jgi:hypothetical protein
MISNIVNILNTINIEINNKILLDIQTELSIRSLIKSKSSNHVSFLIDNKSKEVLSFSFNIYYKAQKFPYSIHSEINTIFKYYKKDIKKNLQRSKKILIVLKISKTGTIGNSKPCKSCANFIFNNLNNLNLINVYYSNELSLLEKLNKKDFISESFTTSSGGRYYTKK